MINKLFVFMIRGYQIIISPLFGKRCRFYPTCSDYALLLFSQYSFSKAFYMTVKRLVKCNPFHPGGYDPVR